MPLKRARTRAARPTSPINDIASFLTYEHPIYRAWKARWALNESRLMGGDEVFDELSAFEYEIDPEGQVKRRREQAIYINFPDVFMSGITGHLLRFAPRPGAALDLGPNLGKVNKAPGKRTEADNLFYKPDGPGNAGANWDLWWADTFRLAGATGHRWVMVESPARAPRNKAEELAGLHPYLVEYSPLDVPNWGFDDLGNLNFAVVRFSNFSPGRLAVVPGAETTETQWQDYLLLVAEGYTELGSQFADGGWWKYTPEKEEYDRGDFDDCLGQIPMFPAFYGRAKGTRKRPAISRPGVTELGQAAIAHMNISSAGNFSAWDGGQGITFMLGIDEEAQQLAVAQIKRGDRYIGVPPNQDTDDAPTIHDKASTSIDSTVFDVREKAIWSAVIQLGISEAVGSGDQGSGQGGPGNTGSAQQARFSSGQAPGIVRLASNIETAQNKALYFYELRSGYENPQAKTSWPKKFDLVELTDRIKQFFEIQSLAAVSSPTLDTNAMLQVADDKGLLTNPAEKSTIEGEFKRSAQLKVKQQQNAANPKPTGPGGTNTAANHQRTKAKKTGPKKNPGGVK